jgi:hypothetical protein
MHPLQPDDVIADSAAECAFVENLRMPGAQRSPLASRLQFIADPQRQTEVANGA